MYKLIFLTYWKIMTERERVMMAPKMTTTVWEREVVRARDRIYKSR
jgi:hypothetical protein